MVMFFLTSGLFLGWSLGANDAANVFGTAVGTRMIRFTTAALICSVFVILGAVIGGAGATHTLGKLGAVNALGGSFMVAFAAAATVYTMTKMSLPVSTSQAVVGSIIGWNFFTGALTDPASFSKIVMTWVLCPLLAAVIAVILFSIIDKTIRNTKPHLLREDILTRWGLILVGAFGSYSLGANNIANVMGVFVPVAPFKPLVIPGLFTFSGAQQLFLLGSIAIAIGVFTYSRRVMETVGSSLMKLTPPMAFVVVLSHSIVLFLFSSQGLESWLASHGLPTIPLVPVSSSQAVIGAVIGIGLLKGGKGIKFKVLGEIATGWVTTPIIACTVTFICLFFLQNVFTVQISRDISYRIDDIVIAQMAKEGLIDSKTDNLSGQQFTRQSDLNSLLAEKTGFDRKQRAEIVELAAVDRYLVNATVLAGDGWLSSEQSEALTALDGVAYDHGWQLESALQHGSKSWSYLSKDTVNKKHNKKLKEQIKAVVAACRVN
jgi:PiT family inorganic phosphate transporter